MKDMEYLLLTLEQAAWEYAEDMEDEYFTAEVRISNRYGRVTAEAMPPRGKSEGKEGQP